VVDLSPEEQDECGYLYHAMGMQYLSAGSELTKGFQTPQDVMDNLPGVLKFYEVVAQNLSLSMELFLKAYLRANLVSDGELGKLAIRHNLKLLVQESAKHGLVVSKLCATVIDGVSEYYALHRFRYAKLKHGGLAALSPIDLRNAAEELFKLSHAAVVKRAKAAKLDTKDIE